MVVESGNRLIWKVLAFRCAFWQFLPDSATGHGRIWPKCPKIAVFETWTFPGYFFVTDGRRVLTIGSYERSWRVVVSFDRFCHLKWPNLAEKPKSFSFPKHGHIRDSQYPLESEGGWGLFVFHKYFLVFLGPNPKGWGPIDSGCPSVRPSSILFEAVSL